MRVPTTADSSSPGAGGSGMSIIASSCAAEATGLVLLTGGWRWRLTCVKFGFLRLDLPRAIVPIADRSGARLYAESQRDSVETTSRVELKARDSRINNAYVRWRTMYTTTLCLPSTWVVRR